MYIDSLTVTALVLFVAALAFFIRFCLVKVCGLMEGQSTDEDQSANGTRGS